ncbi:alanine racemase [Alteromonas sp. 5E99-2]|uniref:alanine racemase n=1 Tax=Alteromonas sp. 5E99-2 TaxID=2817683 RepID=UPI001A991F4A|nr:alanine racemase [Alteromonas sp. 5E99-2]
MNQKEIRTLKHYRSTRAEILGKNLLHNFHYLQTRLQAGALMPVIKADAYGHGDVFAAKTLQQHCHFFAVALIEEALKLRASEVATPVVILEGVYTTEAFEVCSKEHLIPVIHCQEQLDIYCRVPAESRPSCWLKLDIGMHRLGFNHQQIDKAWNTASKHSPTPVVLCGHFSSADSEKPDDIADQLALFQQVQRRLKCDASLANSPAILQWPSSHVAWNRAGICLYGVSASQYSMRPAELKPVMKLIAPVLAIREIPTGAQVGYGGTWVAKRTSTIATIGIGYADGYPRHGSNGAPVWVNGKIAHVVGKVSMDMISIDVTDCEDVDLNTEVELWGNNLPVEDVADHCGTIGYELVTRISSRVPRVYK